MAKKSVAVLMGGRSSEHEVSLQSARNILAAIDNQLFETIVVGIEKQGTWRLLDAARPFLHENDPRRISLRPGGARVTLLPWKTPSPLVRLDGRPLSSQPDVVFPVLHGTFGEDGTIQGLFELAGIPFVGAGVLGSAVAMDKDLTKRVLSLAGVPVARGEVLTSVDPRPAFDRLAGELGDTLFVKPACQGSSVGVHKVSRREDFNRAVEDAFRYDSKILIEEFVEGKEVECSVLGNERPEASVLGEIIPTHEFYSYAAKYLDAEGARTRIPADLPETTTARIRELAIQAFQAICCEGMARIDFFATAEGRVVLNEVNPIPGFTNISMYPKLWEAGGVPQSELVNRLIELALLRHQRDAALSTAVEL